MAKISEKNLGKTGEVSHIKKQEFEKNVYSGVKRRGKAKDDLNYKAKKLQMTFYSFNLTN